MTNYSWVKDLTQFQSDLSPDRAAWLTKPMALSHAIKRVCNTLTVQLIAQDFCGVYPDEEKLFVPMKETPWVRQVFLLGDGVPFTYGRVVVPKETYLSYQDQFDTLGNRLLGETILYATSDVKRDPFEYIQLAPTHDLAKEVYRALPNNFPQTTMWGRRSMFWIKSYPLLVTEVFLPTLPCYQPEN